MSEQTINRVVPSGRLAASCLCMSRGYRHRPPEPWRRGDRPVRGPRYPSRTDNRRRNTVWNPCSGSPVAFDRLDDLIASAACLCGEPDE